MYCKYTSISTFIKNPVSSFSDVSVIDIMSFLVGVADKNSFKLSSLDPRPFPLA